MARYALTRLAALVPTLFGISIVTFLLIRLVPGDVVQVMLGTDAAYPEKVAELRRMFGLDRPIWEQYLDWIGRVLIGDLGTSLRTGKTVVAEIGARLPVTLELALLAFGVAVLVAVPAGIVGAVRAYSLADYLATTATLLGVSVAPFWLGTMLVLVFALWLRVLPPIGYVPFFENPLENLRHMLLPAVSLSAAVMAIVMRMTRSSLLEVVRHDYVRTARAKGLADPSVIVHHALKNALIPVVTVAGIQFARLLGGAVVVEQVFALPGLGRLTVDSIAMRDYPVVQGAVLLVALFFVAVNFVVDMTYAAIDPRIEKA